MSDFINRFQQQSTESISFRPYNPPKHTGANSGAGQEVGAYADTGDLEVRFDTFEAARRTRKEITDSFIHRAIADTFTVGGERVGLKGYLDKVEPTSRDVEVIDDPERVAGLFVATTEMLARNIKVAVRRNDDPRITQERREYATQQKDGFLDRLAHDTPTDAASIADWCRGLISNYPIDAVEYCTKFMVDGRELLNAGDRGINDIRPNIKVQIQIGCTFIMAYTDAMVFEKMADQGKPLTRRIYLNPDLEATPFVFESLLNTANSAGFSLQLKMLQRATDAAMAHTNKRKGEAVGGLRGDGIVVYASAEQANDVLGAALAIAKQNTTTFKGRSVSRLPFKIADGIAIGDNPRRSNVSLTALAEAVLITAVYAAREPGLSEAQATKAFRDELKYGALQNGLDSENLAFSSAP